MGCGAGEEAQEGDKAEEGELHFVGVEVDNDGGWRYLECCGGYQRCLLVVNSWSLNRYLPAGTARLHQKAYRGCRSGITAPCGFA